MVFYIMEEEIEKKDQLIYGKQPVKEALLSELSIDKVFIQQGIEQTFFKEIFPLLRERNIPHQFVPDIKLEKLAGKNHQGIVATVSLIPNYTIQEMLDVIFAKGEIPLIVALDSVTDIRNMGAIARSAYGLGAHAIIIPQSGAAPISAEAIKSSAGALNHIPVCRVPNLRIAIKELKLNGIYIAGLEGKKGLKIDQIPVEEPLCLILGSEDKGINPELKKEIDQFYSIPIFPGMESFNVSVAAGICLYEINKQKTELGI